MSCSRHAIDPEPFPRLRSKGCCEPTNPTVHATSDHEDGTGRLWLATQVRVRLRSQRFAHGYLEAVLGNPCPANPDAVDGWYRAHRYALRTPGRA